MSHTDHPVPFTGPMVPIDGSALTTLARMLVRTPSHRRAEGKERGVVAVLTDHLRGAGLQPVLADVMIDRANVLCTIAGREPGPHLMLCAHSDTRVPDEREPVGTPTADAGDDVIDGVGAAPKCGLAAMVGAFTALHAVKALARGAVTLAVLVDREGEALGAEDLVRSPVRADAAIVAEPTANQLCVGHPGVEFLEIAFAMAAAPDSATGADAVLAAVRFVQSLGEILQPSFSQNAHPRLGPPSLVVRGIHGDRPALHGSRCVVTVERRLMPDETFSTVCDELAEIIRKVEAFIPGLETRLRRVPGTRATLDHVPLLTDERAPIVRATIEALRRVRGDSGKAGVLSSWSDAGMLAFFGGLPAVVLGPGLPLDVLNRSEAVSTADLHEAAALYATAAVAFCSGVAPGQASLV